MGQNMDKLIAEKFSNEGKDVDVLYATTDGQVFLSPADAAKVAEEMAQKDITIYYRDPAVRQRAERYRKLKDIIFAIDYLKMLKAQAKTFIYSQYVEYANLYNRDVVSDDMFDFMARKVFISKRPINVGQRDTIFTWADGIIMASFVRRYEQGVVWLLDNRLIFTCPTNIELAYTDFRFLFKDFLTNENPD